MRNLCSIGLALGLASASPAFAADIAPMPAEPPPPMVLQEGWKFQATLYGWATAINGTTGIRNLPEANIDLSFWDILQNLDGAVMGSFLASNGTFTVLTDLIWSKVSDKTNVGPFGGEVKFEQTQVIATGVVGYRLPIGPPSLDISAIGGARYQHLSAEVNFSPAIAPITISREGDVSWVDPIIGLAMRYDINDKWFVNAITDVGGFGVGSDLTAEGFLTVGYRWTETLSTAIGYRAIYTDYDRDGFRYNTTMHGLFTSIGIHF